MGTSACFFDKKNPTQCLSFAHNLYQTRWSLFRWPDRRRLSGRTVSGAEVFCRIYPGAFLALKRRNPLKSRFSPIVQNLRLVLCKMPRGFCFFIKNT